MLISIAQLMVVLDATIANIALPYIQDSLDISNANLPWIVTGYALAFGGLLLLGGRLADLYGRRRIFMVGLVIFAVASLLGGLATNEGLLLAARGLQGFGAALASPAALALITTTFPAGPARNRAFAVYAAMSGAGAAVGLILGGWLTGLHFDLGSLSVEGWRLTFLINTPIGIVAALFAPRVLAESERHHGELDVPGAITGTLGLLGIVYGLNRAGQHGWGNTWTIVSLVVGAAPARDLHADREPGRAPAAAVPRVPQPDPRQQLRGDVPGPGRDVRDVLLPEPLHPERHGLLARCKAGLAFLPFSFGIVVAAGLSSNLVNRIDARYLAGVGTLMAAGALFGFSRLPYDTSFPATDVTGSLRTPTSCRSSC